MKHKDTKVFDHTALQPLTQNLGGVLAPNPIRWTHEEHETTLEGKSGYGKVRFAELPWAHATSKPFGKVKPGLVGGVSSRMPNQDLRFGKNPKSQPVKRLDDIKPVIPTRQVGPEVLVCAGETKFSPENWQVKVSAKCLRNALRMEEFCKGKVLKKAKPTLVGVIKQQKASFKPGVTGLDKVRKAKPDPIPDWEKEKQERSDLILYWMELRSLYRLIYS